MSYLEGLLTEKVITESIRFSRLLEYEAQYVGEVRAFHAQGVDRILRFQSAINRQLFGAMKELERIQDKRKAKPSPSNHSDREPDGGDSGSGTPCTPVPQTFPKLPFSRVSAIQSESEESEVSAPPLTLKRKNQAGAQSQLPTAGTVPNSCKRPTEWMAGRLTEKAGLPPFEPTKANDETKPTLVVSEKSEVSSSANQNCGTKPTSSVGKPERREHESDANIKWLGVEFIESAEDEAFIESLQSEDGEDSLDLPPERLRNE